MANPAGESAMIPMDWLERYAPGFQALSPEEREAIMHFSFLWSLFESEAMNRRGDANALVAVARQWADADLVTEEIFEPQLAYFRDRYYLDGKFAHHFDYLNLSPADHPDLVKRVLKNEEAELHEIASALLIIVYRFRNNLFHGEKWAYQIHGQLENFKHANTVLMQAIELYRRLPKQE